jgi:hypothetical protein
MATAKNSKKPGNIANWFVILLVATGALMVLVVIAGKIASLE